MTKYYYAGSQRVAMRKNGTLNFILGDHLGSTSLVTDASGTVINETKYKAWGETRYSSGSEMTKYQYTGQYLYANDFGLMYYGARFYDPSLGRFISADIIIPQTQGVQGYDRYAYTNNNPINYTDPSGHCAIDADAEDCLKSNKSNIPTFESKFKTFHADALRIAKNRGEDDTLEAMARIVESAAEIFDGNWDDMMQALGMVFLGVPNYGVGTLYEAHDFAENAEEFPDYFLGEYFADGDFNVAYQDGENQIYHVWGYIANTVVLNGNPYAIQSANNEAAMANNLHEFNPYEGGRSRQDFLLSRAGMVIGSQITNGEVSPYELGDLLRTSLGETASVDDGFVWQYWLLPDAQAQP